MLDISAINTSRALRWHPRGIGSWSLADWACAVGGEVGEILEVIELEVLTPYHERPAARPGYVWKESLGGEIADVYLYLDLFCTAGSLKLTTCAERPGAMNVPHDYSSVAMALSIAADCGKMQDYVKKLNRERDNLPGNRQDNAELWNGIADRVGLMANKLAKLASLSELDLTECVRLKFNAVSCRMGFPERL